MPRETVNPANGQVVARYEHASDAEIDRLLDASRAAYGAWRGTAFEARAACMNRVAARLRDESPALARLMATEMGKPLRQGEAEVEKCAWVCEHYAQHAESFLEPRPVASDARGSWVVFRPLGAVLAVMPWNFPLWQFFRFAAPTVMAGNVAILRHASNVTGCALTIGRLFTEAGFPEAVVSIALADKDQVARMIEDARVAAVTLTGSVAAGRAVGATAGGAVKKSVHELGGSDAYVVLRDANLDLAVERCAASRLINSGQSCIAAKRFIVEAPLFDGFVAGLVEALRSKCVGPPLEADVDVGPIARPRVRDRLDEQVRASVAAGAKCVLGGRRPDTPGFFYPPTVLTGVEPGMPAFDTETFGPVAAVTRAVDAEDAIRLANESAFGLGAAVFTEDLERGREIAATRLRAGSCFVNDFVRSDPRLPFGGVKDSGYGRELGERGIREFVNVKTVYVA